MTNIEPRRNEMTTKADKDNIDVLSCLWKAKWRIME